MNKTIQIFFLILCLTIASNANAQKVMRSFKGRVVDSATQLPLKDVSICLYRASDTSLINFGFTTPNGNFKINTSNQDSVILIYSMVGFNEKIKRMPAMIGEWSFSDFGEIKLSTANYTLKTFSVKVAAIRMNGDTMEINATRFKVLPGSDVAQLFKKIPGFEVNVKGEIKVAGAPVEKIMVDGSDFFGNNPGMVSKNLTADMIETVQVFEEKNEDGSPKASQSKIINLKLKKGKRNGTFGDILAGGGNNGRYESGIRLNSFKNDRKISFIANANNINETGFDFGFDNWHRAQNDDRSGGGNNMFFYSSSSFDNASNEGNLNNTAQTGVSYFNEFSRKRKFSVNLFVERNKFNSISASNSSNPFNDSVRRFNIDSNIINGLAYSTSLQMSYTKMRDSTLRFETGVRSSIDLNDLVTNKDNIIRFNTTEINRGVNELKSNFKNSYLRVTGFLEKRWRKDLRYRYSISSNFRNFQVKNNLYQYLKNTNDTFNNLNNQNINRQEFLIKVFGQMPVSKYWSLNFSADRWLQNNVNNQLTNGNNMIQQANFNEAYNAKIDTLSVDFTNRIEQYSAHPYISFYKNRFYFNFGSTFMRVNMSNVDNTKASSVPKQYNKFLPSMVLSYNAIKLGYFSLQLEKSILFPSSSDLLPVLNLNNNYQRFSGNNNLQPQESYKASTYISIRKIKGFKSIYLIGDASFSDNAKIYTNTINNEGIVVQKPINETGLRTMNLSGGFDKKLGKQLVLNTYISNQASHTPTYYNSQKTFTNVNNWSIYPGLTWAVKDSFEAGVSLSINNQNFKNNLNQKLNYQQTTVGYDFKIRALFKWGMELNSNINFNDQRKVPGIGKIVTVWNLYLQQPLGKKAKFNVKLTAYDILKQNTSISRYVNENAVYISQSNQLTQYFMLSLVYKIKKMGGDEDAFDYVY
ncbi:MAG: hypothetical protein PSX81_14090 [bacterium]|nr:hypothetical protein [bacterium]